MRASTRRTSVMIALAAMLLPNASNAQTPSANDRIAGEWIFEMTGDAQPQRVVLRLEADTLRGRVYGQDLIGAVKGTRVEFRVGSFRWRATIRGDTLTGWLGVDRDSSTWRGTRFRAPAVARRFNFSPTSWQRGVSATVSPVLRLAPGDTVQTSTLDAGGWGKGAFGERGNRPSEGGNPLVGPFYVEGTVPGDVLVLKLHRVRLNRTWAFSGTEIVDQAVDAGYARDRKYTNTDNKWTLDTATATARLTAPSPALAAYRVPLRPFLGVVATAPSQIYTPSSRDAGSFGGNMESAHLTEGATVYLPVSTMGAYLYVGDGHAAQGDGELTGDAMETSLDVTFSVEIKRWGFASMVRAENAEYIMSLSNGGSLDEAMRRATADMARWIESEYQVNANDVALILGFAMRYDIPDLVPPSVGVTARVPKSALATLTRRK